jgi:hypothetical protein
MLMKLNILTTTTTTTTTLKQFLASFVVSKLTSLL